MIEMFLHCPGVSGASASRAMRHPNLYPWSQRGCRSGSSPGALGPSTLQPAPCVWPAFTRSSSVPSPSQLLPSQQPGVAASFPEAHSWEGRPPWPRRWT